PSSVRRVRKITTLFLTGHLSFFFRAFGSILGSALCAIVYPGGIQRTADNVVAHTRQVFHSSAANQNNGVLLKVMALSGNICIDFLAVRQTHPCDLPHSRIRFFRSGGIHTRTDPASLRTGIQSRRFAFLGRSGSSLSY